MENKQQEITEKTKLDWEYYQSHRQYLRSEKHFMDNKFSQLLVYLDSGIFITSSVLVNMYDKVEYKWVIVTSWWLSTLSLIFVLLSFIFSIQSFKHAIQLWDKERKEDLNNIYIKVMNTSTCISTFLVFLAIIFTLIFFTLNFLFMSDNTPKTFVESESVMVQKNHEQVSAGISPTEFFSWETGTWTGK